MQLCCLRFVKKIGQIYIFLSFFVQYNEMGKITHQENFERTLFVKCLKMHVYPPSLGEDDGKRVAQYFSLVSNVFHDIFRPFHQVSDLVARRRPVYIPFQHFLYFFSQHPLKCMCINISET